MTEPLNLVDFEAIAKERLPKSSYDYFAGGANDEVTLETNRAAFRRISLAYRVLVDVAVRDLSITLLGSRLAVPLVVAPTALHRLAHPDGESATARAAASAGALMTLSSLTSVSLEDVAPLLGRRERDLRNPFELPEDVSAVHFQVPTRSASGTSPLHAVISQPSITWRDLAWIRSTSRLPLVLKGLVRADDARRALDHGVDAIWVSNHGGRQLDTSVPAIDALPGIARVVKGRVPILLDGWVRRGTDVLKAFALGANAVAIGRPVLYGLAADGENGVLRVLSLLVEELSLAMALAGCRSVAEIDASLIVNDSFEAPRGRTASRLSGRARTGTTRRSRS